LAAEAIQRSTRQLAEPVAARERGAVNVAGVLSLVLAAIAAPAIAASPAIGPNDLDSDLAALPAGTVVCNDQSDGGWLMLRHPGLRPTMDTRVELYSIDHIQGYLGFMAAGPGWESYPERMGCAYAVLHSEAAVVPQMRVTGDWAVVQQSPGYVLLRSSGL
jgi:hypothetical protein